MSRTPEEAEEVIRVLVEALKRAREFVCCDEREGAYAPQTNCECGACDIARRHDAALALAEGKKT